jgi:hypothetical protein
MKERLGTVCRVVAGITALHCPAFAETAMPSSTAPAAVVSAPSNGPSSQKTAADCDEEWRADRKTMMEHDMTEESYVEQCIAANDVPALPAEKKTNTVPAPSPK